MIVQKQKCRQTSKFMFQVSSEDFPDALSHIIALFLRPREATSFFGHHAPDYWLKRSKQEFKVSEEEFKRTILSSEERYIQLLTLQGEVTEGSEEYIGHFQYLLISAVRERDIDLAQYFNSKTQNKDPTFYLSSKNLKNLYSSILASVDPFTLTEYLDEPNAVVDLLFTNCPSSIPSFLMRYQDRLSSINKRKLKFEESFISGDRKVIALYKRGSKSILRALLAAMKLNSVPLFNELTKDFPVLQEDRRKIVSSVACHASLELFNVFVENTGLGRNLILQVSARDASRKGNLEDLIRIIRESGDDLYTIFFSRVEAIKQFEISKSPIFLDIIEYLASLGNVGKVDFLYHYPIISISLLRFLTKFNYTTESIDQFYQDPREYPLLLSFMLEYHPPSKDCLNVMLERATDNKYIRDILLRYRSEQELDT